MKTRREFKGKVYTPVVKKGKVQVYCESTAPGQMIRVGIFDAQTKTWDKGNDVPETLKRDFERLAPTKIEKESKSDKHYTLKGIGSKKRA